MDSRLLPCPDANGLSVRHITDGIGLCELERNPGDEHVTYSRVRQVLAFRDDVGKIITCHRAIIATLLHAHTKDLTGFSQLWLISLINLDYSIFALLLFLEDFQGIGLIPGSDHAI